MNKSKLIVIEGLDASGKATQTTLLCQALSNIGVDNQHVSFPDYNEPSSALVKMYLGGEFGKNPNDVNAYAASTFYAVDRFASYKKKWEQNYLSGQVIIADRYTTSNLIYQLAKLPKDEWDDYIAWAEDFEYNKLGLPRPNQVIFLSMDPAISQKLLVKRYNGEDKRDIHEKNIAYLKQCYESAQYVANKQHWNIIQCASGNQVLSADSIQEKVLTKYFSME